MSKPKILAFAGSLRRESVNFKLAAAAAQAAREAGAEVTLLNLRDYPLDIYDGDLEAEHGLPENVLKLKAIFDAHAGYLIACPEYNGGFTPVLKNTLDWISRPAEGERRMQQFADKPVGIMAASPGAQGGIRMLPMLRMQLSYFGMLVLPGWHAMGGAHKAFDQAGKLTQKTDRDRIDRIAKKLVKLASA